MSRRGQWPPHVVAEALRQEAARRRVAAGDTEPAPEPEQFAAPADAHAGPEAELQTAVEQWLAYHGYGRGEWGARGCYVHLPRAIGNPLLLDLLLLGEDGRFLAVELKSRRGRVSPQQRALLASPHARLCWSLDQFTGAVREWESATTEHILD